MHRIVMGSALVMAALASLAAPPVFAAGAIVSTPVRGTYIFMTHRPTPGYASDLAMSDCMGKYGGGCRVLVAYGAGCMAIAQSHDGSHHSGWAVKPFPAAADQWALAQCEKYGAPCSLDVAKCE